MSNTRTTARKARVALRCGWTSHPIKPGDIYLEHTEFPGGDSGYADAAGHPVQIPECEECATRYGRAPLIEAKRQAIHPKPLSERFWAKVDRRGPKECWPWLGAPTGVGYGRIQGNKRGSSILAHRLSYELHKGPIGEGLLIDHMCHNRICVNPAHLRETTQKQNIENQSGVRRDNSYGLRGVSLNKRTGKYRARVDHNGHEYYGGEYSTAEEAGEAARHLRLSLFTHNDIDKVVNK